MASKTDANLLRSAIDFIILVFSIIFIILRAIIKSLNPNKSNRLKSIKGEIVLITGGGGGLGRLLAIRIAELEATVVLWDVNKEAVDETVKLVEKIGGKVYGFRCDLADKDDVYKIAQKTREEVGNISILINNAGVTSSTLLLETSDRQIQRTFDVNILAHFWTTKAFLPNMIKHNHGHIVTIASMAGFVGVHKLVDYCSSKFAAVGFDEALRVELESQGVHGVKTTVICPYFIQATGMFENVHSRYMSTLKSSDVADRIVEAFRRNETCVMIPGFFRFGMILKQMVPWNCTSRFLQELVRDVAPPTVQNIGKPSEKLDGNKSNTIQSTVASLNNSQNGISGKNL